MKAAYEKENADLLAKMGVAGATDTRQHGAESLFPKIGYGMTLAVPPAGPRFRGAQASPVRRPARPALSQDRLGIRQGRGRRDHRAPGGETAGPSELTRLAATVKQLTPALDPSITGLPVDGFLGDALDTPAGRKHVPDLVRFCTDTMNAMTVRIATDAVLTEAERKTLQAMPRATTAQKSALFAVWRDMEFSHAVRAAVRAASATRAWACCTSPPCRPPAYRRTAAATTWTGSISPPSRRGPRISRAG